MDTQTKTHVVDQSQPLPRPARRAFLRDGLLAATAGLTVTGFGVRRVLAQARKMGKPPFTEATVNKFLASSSEPDYRRMCEEAQKDLGGFVRKTFYLTPGQEKSLNNLTPEQVRKIQGAFKQSQEQNARLAMKVKMVPAARPSAEMARQRAPVPPAIEDGGQMKQIAVECGKLPDGTIYCKITWECSAT